MVPLPPISAGGGGPSSAGTSADSSGWVVNFGAGSVNAGPSSEIAKFLPFVLIGAAVLVAVRLSRRKK